MMSGTLGLVVILLAVWPKLLLNASYRILLLETPSSARQCRQRHVPVASKPIKFGDESDMIQC